eukprot:1252478-Rhodomonas_salina.3
MPMPLCACYVVPSTGLLSPVAMSLYTHDAMPGTDLAYGGAGHHRGGQRRASAPEEGGGGRGGGRGGRRERERARCGGLSAYAADTRGAVLT